MKLYYETSLSHHGIKGQKWGVRRYQNEDGTLTAAGRKRMYRDIKDERRSFETSEKERLLKKYRIDNKYRNLDTKDHEYAKKLDKINKQRDEVIQKAKDNTYKMLVDKYGEDTLKDMKKRDDGWDLIGRVAVSAVIGFIGARVLFNTARGLYIATHS